MNIDLVNFVCGGIGIAAVLFLTARNKISDWWLCFFLGMFFMVMSGGAIGLIVDLIRYLY